MYIPLEKKAINECRDYSPDYGGRAMDKYHPLSTEEEGMEKQEDKDNLIGVDVQQDYMTYSPIRPMGRKKKAQENLGFQIVRYEKDKEELTIDMGGKESVYECDEYNYKHLIDFIQKGWFMNAIKIFVKLKEMQTTTSSKIRRLAKQIIDF